MNPDLDTLATALYVTIDDLLVAHPRVGAATARGRDSPEAHRCGVGDVGGVAGLVGVHLGGPLRSLRQDTPAGVVPDVPERAGYNKRLRRSGELIAHMMAALARDCPSWHDDVWLVDSTPVECGRSRETQKRSDLADGPPTATAPRTPGTSGARACTCSQHRRVCPSPSPSPARKPTNATRAWT